MANIVRRDRMSKERAKAARDHANRMLTVPTEKRETSAGPMSFPIKARDRLVDSQVAAFLAKRVRS